MDTPYARIFSRGDFEQIFQAELLQLEQRYQMTFLNLRGDLFFGLSASSNNPFEEVLDRVIPSLTSGSEEVSPPEELATLPPEEIGLTGPAPEPGAGNVEDSPDPEYDLLLAGALTEDKNVVIVRAVRDEDGGITLEDSSRLWLPSPALVASELLTFESGEQVVTTDLDQDGVVDLVVSSWTFLGTIVESFIQYLGGFVREASGFFPQQLVQNFAVIDFDSDGQSEIAFIIRKNPHLVVYERRGDQIQYRNELVLPIKPALVIGSKLSGLSNIPQLHVFSAPLDRVVSLMVNGSGGGPLVINLQTPLTSLRTLRPAMNNLPSEMWIFEDDHQFALGERTEQELIFYGRLGVHFTQVTPRCSMSLRGGLSTRPARVRGTLRQRRGLSRLSVRVALAGGFPLSGMRA